MPVSDNQWEMLAKSESRLQTRIAELEAIIRACFVVWKVDGRGEYIVMCSPKAVSDDMATTIIEIGKPYVTGSATAGPIAVIRKPDAPTAPGAAPCDRPTS